MGIQAKELGGSSRLYNTRIGKKPKDAKFAVGGKFCPNITIGWQFRRCATLRLFFHRGEQTHQGVRINGLLFLAYASNVRV